MVADLLLKIVYFTNFDTAKQLDVCKLSFFEIWSLVDNRGTSVGISVRAN